MKRRKIDRILTDDDYANIKKLQIKKALLNKKRARPEAEESSEEENVNGLVNPESIRGKHKKQKLSKEERIEGIKAGREGRVEFGAKAKLNKKKS